MTVVHVMYTEIVIVYSRQWSHNLCYMLAQGLGQESYNLRNISLKIVILFFLSVYIHIILLYVLFFLNQTIANVDCRTLRSAVVLKIQNTEHFI